MSKQNSTIVQTKDINGKLSKPTVKNAVSGFKNAYTDRQEDDRHPITGFVLAGGTGMTAGARETWEEFTGWCNERGLDYNYNTQEQIEQKRDTLRNRIENKNKNRN